jgi:hypothetical protein
MDNKFSNWKPKTNLSSFGTNNNKFGINKDFLNKDSGIKKPESKMKGVILKSLSVLLGVILVLTISVYFVIVRPIMSLTQSINVIQGDVNNVTKALITDRDLVAYDENLKKLEIDLKNLKSERDNKIGHLKNFPIVKDYYSDTDYFINTGLKLIEGGKEIRPIVEPFADALGMKISKDQEVKKIGFADAVAQWITIMPKVAEKLDPVIIKLEEAGKELSKVDAKKYNINILGIYKRDYSGAIVFAQKTLLESRNYGPDMKEALLIFPGVLGVGTGEKRYMIIMQNDAEIRATGGFWTNFATFKIQNALLTSDFSSKDMYSIDITLDAIDKFYTFPTAPESYKRFLKVERLYARDANISPDFPTALEKFNLYYKLAAGVDANEYKPIDGYIAINTEVVKELMEITGPVNVNGVTFSKDNVVLELEKIASLNLAQQVGRKKVLGDLMEAMLKNVFESESFLWSQLIEKGVDLMNRKQILIALNDKNAQRLVEKYGYAGRIVDPVTGDYSFVVSTNLGGDKTNLFVTREISHSLSKENNRWVRTTKVKYSYPRPTAEFNDFVKRYQDWFRFYVPEGSELISMTGNEVETVYQDKERGKQYFGGFMTLAPEETKEISVKYYIPDNLIKNGEYSLYIQKQSGQSAEKYEFDVMGKKQEFEVKGKKTNFLMIDTDYTLNVKLN